MSDILRGYSLRKGYRPRDVEIDPLDSGHNWNHDDDEEPNRFRKEFYELLESERDFRRGRGYGLPYENGSSEMMDFRKPKIPTPGQIIWDDIGDTEAVDSLSWSQSDVEREIETWDQRLRESELRAQRSFAWDDGDMMRFDECRDVYLPRRKSSGYYESEGRGLREGRTRRDGENLSLSRFSSCSDREYYVSRERKEVEGRYRDKVRRTRREGIEGVPKFEPNKNVESRVPTREERFKPPKTSDGDCRCSCDHTYTSYKQEETALFPPSAAKPEVKFFHQQTSAPSSVSPSSGVYYLSSKHWLSIIIIVLVGGAVGVALPYALRVQEGTTFDDRLALASTLLKQVPLIDGHNDLPWNIRKFLHNRLKDFKFREDLRQIKPWSSSAWSHTDLPRLRAGHVSAQFWSAYVPCEAQFKDAVQLAFEQVDVIRRLTERFHPDLTLCTTSTDIIAAHSRGQLCSLIGVEGGHSVGSSLPVLRALYEVGVRYLTLTSTCNTPWADCSLMDSPDQKSKQNGLTNFGKSVVKEMNRLGMVVDLSHVSEATMLGALNISKAPVIFSHSSAHALCNSTRNVPDRVLKQLPSVSFRSICTTAYCRSNSKCPGANKFVDCCKIDKCMVNPCKPEPSVVIIGGGIAGLSAAQRLVHCGIRNFTVLEATDRPGGRIHSCWMGDVVAEMGAQFINGGCVANPVFTLAAQEGLLSNPLPRPDERGLFCTSDGRAIDFPVSITAYHTFKKIEQQAAALFSMGCGRTHGNLLNFLGIRIQQELHNFPEEQRYDAARVMYGLTNILRAKCGDDLSLISADQFGSYIEIPGGDVRVPLGYVGVLAPLLRDLPECSVRYCKPVQSVLWGTVGSCCGPRAIVKCCDGEEFQADYVIVTVSLGVLKAKHDKMFCPALPCEKVEAIKKLGFGVVNKIFLEYCRPFWVWREGGIKLAWSADELSSRDDWIKGLCYVEELAGSQHVLCAWVAGREATTMELCSEEEVAESITRVLRQFTGDPCLPYPSNILRSKWTADCNFCGSYSYMGLESNVGQQCDLGSPVPGSCEPIAPILLFAGEATVPGHYSTVHGARLSGIREAERIIQLTKRFGGPPLPPENLCCCP